MHGTSRNRWCLVAALLFLLLASGVAGAGDKQGQRGKKDKQDDKAETFDTQVDRWLVLGPAPYPLPALHDDARGKFERKDLLESAPLELDALHPVEGGTVEWFVGGPLSWLAADVKRGTLPLDSTDEGPAIAWLAANVVVSRWLELELTVEGAHPRRLWLDGEDVVQGGLKDGEESVSKKVQLTPGAHRLLIQYVRDP